jgi:ribosomal protein S12 methylthiotransferase accessory factor
MEQDEAIDWLPAWSLRDQERRYIPADAVLYGQPKSEKERVAVFESNGLSAGNTLDEAITQGLFELIERDATAIWWFNKLRRPAFDTQCMEQDAWFERTLERLKTEGCKVHFLDLTLDTGVPVVAAIGVFGKGYLIGYGCHLDGRLALNRALTELIQVKALMSPVVPPLGFEEISYLFPEPSARTFDTIPCNFEEPEEVRQMTHKVIARLTAMHLDTIVVNCTRPEIALPVAKVIVPGLRAFRPRFGAGRLYEVPVALGLLDKPQLYEELNPMWMTIAPFKQEIPVEV